MCIQHGHLANSPTTVLRLFRTQGLCSGVLPAAMLGFTTKKREVLLVNARPDHAEVRRTGLDTLPNRTRMFDTPLREPWWTVFHAINIMAFFRVQVVSPHKKLSFRGEGRICSSRRVKHNFFHPILYFPHTWSDEFQADFVFCPGGYGMMGFPKANIFFPERVYCSTAVQGISFLWQCCSGGSFAAGLVVSSGKIWLSLQS